MTESEQTVLAVVGSVLFGAVLGSFACCQAWRLRYYLKNQDHLGERSVCMYCRRQLAWFDNIPIFSWLFLRGKCRYCRHRIGWAEPLSELASIGVALVVTFVYILPLIRTAPGLSVWELTLGIITVVAVAVLFVALGVLSVYDAKWGELPTRPLFLAVICAALIFGLNQESLLLAGAWSWTQFLSALAGVVILPGVCFALYRLSHETMMGGGDWLLALSIALVLGDWWLALWVMAGANLLGALLTAPAVISRRRTTIHFGPFLVLAFVLVLAGQEILLGMI